MLKQVFKFTVFAALGIERTTSYMVAKQVLYHRLSSANYAA
jgi:hypothetical protein